MYCTGGGWRLMAGGWRRGGDDGWWWVVASGWVLLVVDGDGGWWMVVGGAMTARVRVSKRRSPETRIPLTLLVLAPLHCFGGFLGGFDAFFWWALILQYARPTTARPSRRR